MDHLRPRPVLPSSTPVPQLPGRKNPYSGTSFVDEVARFSGEMKSAVPAKFDGVGDEKAGEFHSSPPPLPPVGIVAQSANTKSQERILRKLILKLPFELRESIDSAVNMVMRQSDMAVKELETSHVELKALRTELKHKIGEIDTLHKTCDIYKEKMRALEQTLGELRDNMDSRQKFIVRNRRSVDRMASTNKMLIDSLDALQMKQATTPGALPGIDEGKEVEMLDEPAPATGISDKLRESLLRVSREHYRSIKQVEVMEQRIDQLKAALKAAEQMNRQLKLEVDELQSRQEEHGFDRVGKTAGKDDVGAGVKNIRTYSKLDERFQALVNKQAIDPVEGMTILRRLLAYMGTASGTLDIAETARHIASREIMRIFDAEMVCLFVVPPNTTNELHKYTPRSVEAEVFPIRDTPSLVAEVLQQTQVARINALSKVQYFNMEIDGYPGLEPKRILSVPLLDVHSNKVLGVIHLINKGVSGNIYSEADEVFALVYADQAACLLAACFVHSRVCQRADLLSGLLEASTGIYNVIPDPDSFTASKDLHPGELLLTLEQLSRESLNCAKTKAFLTSVGLGKEPGELVVLEKKPTKAAPSRSAVTATKSIGDHSGIVGNCLKSRTWKQGTGEELEMNTNPQVDLDSNGSPMVTVPVINLEGTVLAVLQLVPGEKSPKFYNPDVDHFDKDVITFQQAVQWFVHQISHPLNFLLGYIGRPPQRPVSTPSNFSTPVFSLQNFLTAEFPDNSSVRKALRGAGSGSDFTSLAVDERTDSLNADRHQPQAQQQQLLRQKSKRRSLGGDAEGDSSKMQPSPLTVGKDYLTVEQLTLKLQQLVVTSSKAFDDSASVRTRDQERNVILKEVIQSLNQAFQSIGKPNTESQFTAEAAQPEVPPAPVEVKPMIEKCASTETAEIAVLKEELSRRNAELESVRTESVQSIEATKIERDKMLEVVRREHFQEIQKHDVQLSEFQLVAEREKEDIRAEFSALLDETRSKLVICEAKLSEINELKCSNVELQDAVRQRNEELRRSNDYAQELSQSLQQTQETNDQLNRQVDTLAAKISEKEAIMAILQDQLVKMAGENLKELSSAARKAIAAAEKPEADIIREEISKSRQGRRPSADGSTSDILRKETTNSVEPKARPPVSPRPDNIQSATGPPNTPPPLDRSKAPSVAKLDRTATVDVAKGWELLYDELGQAYYYNAETGESSWYPPGSEQPDGDGKMVGDWKQHFDELGQEYWVNMVTGATEWTIPDGGGSSQELKSQDSVVSASAGGYTIEL